MPMSYAPGWIATHAGRKVDANDFHLHNLLIKGVAVDGESPIYDDVRHAGQTRYRRFNFTFNGYRYDTHQEQPDGTAYRYAADGMHYHGKRLAELPLARIDGDEDTWGCEWPWYLKRLRDQASSYELRLNPVNACANVRFRTGDHGQFRGCGFCHRVYAAQRTSEYRTITSPPEIFADIFTVEGREIVPRIHKVLMITGDTKDPEQLLDIAETVYRDYLQPNGFQGTFSLATHLIRSEAHLRRLAALDDQLFDCPVECFTRREELLGPVKRVPLDKILAVLRRARQWFRFVRINLVIGIEPLRDFEAGLRRLVEERLIDDVIANVLGTYTPAMKTIRTPGADDVEFVFQARDIMHRLGVSQKRSGVTKSAFYTDTHDVGGQDLLIRSVAARCPLCGVGDERGAAE